MWSKLGPVASRGFSIFSLALKHLGELDAWSDEQCGALIDKAKTALGKTSGQWDKVDIAELGNVLRKCPPNESVWGKGSAKMCIRRHFRRSAFVSMAMKFG